MSQREAAKGNRPRPQGRKGEGRAAEARAGDNRVEAAAARQQVGHRARQRAEQAQAAQRRKMGLWIGGGSAIVVVAIVVVALVLNLGGSPNAAGLTNPNDLNPAANTLPVGSQAPNFNLATVDGKRYSLTGQRGHVVLLEFFAVWCPICQGEAPIMHQIDAAFASKGERTLAILANPYGPNYDNSGRTDTTLAKKADVNWFEKTFAVTHPSLIDPSFNTVNQYGAGAYPTIYVIDRHGVIRYASQGHEPYATLASAITSAMTH